MANKLPERVGKCGVRTKYAKPQNPLKYKPFQLYTKYSNPGLVNIFFNEDKRCFHNWGFEAGPKQKRGRIREAFDHQINAPVMELNGPHDGSVYMVCPPNPKSSMNVDMPYVTILMRDLHGYSSVEFQVLDSMGYSRKVLAKNFRARCTIGELNLEIPMRLSPTWNYACVNLDDALHSAFGTRLTAIQRIKINASARVRRVYFSEEIFPYKTLPQQFRINLSLTPEEKLEIQMSDEFFSSEAAFFNAAEQKPPWSLPKLCLGQKQDLSILTKTSKYSMNHLTHLVPRKKGDIIEIPAAELEPEKYDDVKIPDLQTESNAALLREMLQKSIPPSKNVLPTLSLIYPDQHEQNSGDDLFQKRVQEYLRSRGGPGQCYKSCDSCPKDDDYDDDYFEKLKKCIEVESNFLEHGGEDFPKQETDWDKINNNYKEDEHHSVRKSRHHRMSHFPHHEPCKHDPKMLAKYLKLREVFGDYDLFNARIKNPRFLHLNPHIYNEEEGADEVEEEEDEEEDADEEEGWREHEEGESVPELTDGVEIKTIMSSHRRQSQGSQSEMHFMRNENEHEEEDEGAFL